MKKTVILFFLMLWAVFFVFAQTNPNHVKVKGYYRKDGTYVQPHYRTAPNSTNRDNFSTKGNVNPYTGKAGWIDPDNKTNSTYSIPSSTSNNSNSYNYLNSTFSTYKNSETTNTYREIEIKNYLRTNSYYSDDPSYVTTTTANVREQMTTSSAIITTLPSNSEVKVIDSFFGDWWKIYYGEGTGYIHRSLIQFKSEGNSKSSYTSYYDSSPTYVTTVNTSLREHMDAGSAILARVPVNNEVKVIDSFFGNWWKVSYQNRTGYIHSSVLKFRSEGKSNTNSYNYYSNNPTYITKSNSNLREHMSTSSSILTTISGGEEVKVVDSFFGTWWKIYYNGRTGYIHSSLIRPK